jgi:hypothetical protein
MAAPESPANSSACSGTYGAFANGFTLSTGYADALLCVAAIPYLPDLAKAVTEWRRVSQADADLVFTTPPPTALPP